MFSSIFVVLAFLLSLGFSGVVAVALITYIRRTWQLIRMEGDGSIQDRILNGVHELQLRMDLLTERLDRLDEALGAGFEPPELPRGDEDPPAP